MLGSFEFNFRGFNSFEFNFSEFNSFEFNFSEFNSFEFNFSEFNSFEFNLQEFYPSTMTRFNDKSERESQLIGHTFLSQGSNNNNNIMKAKQR